MARYLSCPAVSHICALIVLVSTWIDRVANSTPMVDFESRLNSLRVKRLNRLDLPTPESPMRTTLNKKSYSSLAMVRKMERVSRDQGGEDKARRCCAQK